MTRDAAARSLSSFWVGSYLRATGRGRLHSEARARAGELQTPESAWCRDSFTGNFGPGQTCPGQTKPRQRPQRQASAELCECECECPESARWHSFKFGPARRDRARPGGGLPEALTSRTCAVRVAQSLLMRTEATARGIMLPGVRVTRVSESGPGRSGLRAARPYRDTWSLQSSRAHHSLRSDSPLPHPPTALTVARSPPPPPAGPLLRAGRRHAQAGPARNGRPSGGRGLEGKGGRWGCQR